jgi:predicted metalloprotease with PDZ domain
MVLGEQGVLTENSYLDLLGLASHELFHAWNIAKIRPKELLPYDYTKENYFTTCFVAEGFTTYFGDRTLYDSGVFSSEQYKHELETTFKRHFYDSDHASQSLLESSFDLWVDGYEKGTPNKKVSVYHKGAIATLILDAMIRRKFSNKKSMENVMQKLYLEFGNLNKGYSYEDIKRICEEVFEGDLSTYFKNVIEGNTPIFELTQEATLSMGWTLLKTDERLELTF